MMPRSWAWWTAAAMGFSSCAASRGGMAEPFKRLKRLPPSKYSMMR